MDFDKMINGLHGQSMNWNNFSGNKTAYGFDSDFANFMNYMGFDSDFANYTGMAQGFNGKTAYGANGAISMPAWMAGAPDALDQKATTAWLNKQVASGAMTTYRLSVYYTPGGGLTHEPVDVTFFAGTFNKGTFTAGGDLQFTNALGDTATITSRTKDPTDGEYITMEQLMSMMETEPATLGFIRMIAKTVDQLGYDIGVVRKSQYGAGKGNSIVPDDYVDPYQYQFTRVDVPMNVPLSRKEGFKWTIDEDQTGSGVGMTLFIPTTIDNTKPLKGENPIRVLNDGQVPTFGTPTAPSSLQAFQTSALAVNPQIKSIINNPMIPRPIGQALIKNIAKGE